jgi:hypothetical protein
MMVFFYMHQVTSGLEVWVIFSTGCMLSGTIDICHATAGNK